MSDKETVKIDCGDALSIADVGDLYAELLVLLAEGKTVQFDASQLERVDAAALQVLYAYSKEAVSNGNPLIWDQASEAFCRSARLLGLAQLMNIDKNTV
ncbi:MAG: hypothetical protein DRQ39_00635 [Gammaproteobacteria bacterium]|nr:MAG: hypothetical protein DRQ39_00635 [Gammaproteobacteria bacterium]RKZ95485.1 MAG: hypothetical protein DRQ40_03515 [Gammaproteobacteria bacterium]RKZ98589.1 MAG: hypothetical protein DRQ46_01690 [Gammaproteobacteria bacterium]RLA00511.1 MAG: hypothetical protein DRQ42_05370 [Gammaproteobacteria bacterium]